MNPTTSRVVDNTKIYHAYRQMHGTANLGNVARLALAAGLWYEENPRLGPNVVFRQVGDLTLANLIEYAKSRGILARSTTLDSLKRDGSLAQVVQEDFIIEDYSLDKVSQKNRTEQYTIKHLSGKQHFLPGGFYLHPADNPALNMPMYTKFLELAAQQAPQKAPPKAPQKTPRRKASLHVTG